MSPTMWILSGLLVGFAVWLAKAHADHKKADWTRKSLDRIAEEIRKANEARYGR